MTKCIILILLSQTHKDGDVTGETHLKIVFFINVCENVSIFVQAKRDIVFPGIIF